MIGRIGHTPIAVALLIVNFGAWVLVARAPVPTERPRPVPSPLQAAPVIPEVQAPPQNESAQLSLVQGDPEAPVVQTPAVQLGPISAALPAARFVPASTPVAIEFGPVPAPARAFPVPTRKINFISASTRRLP
jgi:hypothetical protein